MLRGINEKLANLTVKDIDIKFSRNKNDNLSTKSQAYATLINTKTLDPVDALEMVDITTNVTEVIKRGEAYQLKQQEQSIEYNKKLKEISQEVNDNTKQVANGDNTSQEANESEEN